MKTRNLILSATVAAIVVATGTIAYHAHATRAAITGFEQTVIDRATASPAPWTDTLPDTLPEPVARYFAYVFPDGPRPTGLRYCMNSVSLDFRPREQ